MSDVFRSSELEGRRVYRARRPSSHNRKALAAAADSETEAPPEEETVEVAKVGKVRACLFHPSRRQCLGILIRRPDALWMFHRKDLWAPLTSLELEDKSVLIDSGAAHDAKPGFKVGDDGLRLSECVIWTGLDIVTESGDTLGFVSDVTFDRDTGAVESLTLGEGGASQALLGSVSIPADLIRGFKRGVGSELVDEHGATISGAIVVDDAVATAEKEGGLADTAGKAAAKAMHKVSQTASSVKPAIVEKANQFKTKYIDVDDEEQADAGASEEESTGDAFERGAKAVGQQLKRAQGMFGDFLDEYRKARDE